jgi:hypothetical protein
VGPGRSHGGKLLVAGTVEIAGNRPGLARLQASGDYSAESLSGFVAGAVARRHRGQRRLVRLRQAEGRQIRCQGRRLDWPPMCCCRGSIAFANPKRWALGVYHGLRRKHLQSDPGLGPAKPDPRLDEFVFRFNRRKTRHAACCSPLGIGVTTKQPPMNMLIAPEATA